MTLGMGPSPGPWRNKVVEFLRQRAPESTSNVGADDVDAHQHQTRRSSGVDVIANTSTSMGTIWRGTEASEAKSLAAAGERLRVCFRNQSDQTLILCWVGSDGTPHHYYQLHPYESPSLVPSEEQRSSFQLPFFSKRRGASESSEFDLITTKDHVETTQTGHAFLVAASNDTEETAKKKSLECGGTTLIGAYRPSRVRELHVHFDENDDDSDSIDPVHLVTIQDTRSMEYKKRSSSNNSSGCMPCSSWCGGGSDQRPVGFVRQRRVIDNVEDGSSTKTDHQTNTHSIEHDMNDDDDETSSSRWIISVRQGSFDPTPLDSTCKSYTRVSIADNWPICIEGDWCPAGNNEKEETSGLEQQDDSKEKKQPICPPDFQSTLESDLSIALSCMPQQARDRLRETTPIWVNNTFQYGPKACPVNAKEMCFHPGSDWLVRNGMHPEKKHGVELYDASDYMRSRQYWQPGGLLIHELSHAYHWNCCQDGYDNKEILDCYKAAMKDGLYDMVQVHGSEGTEEAKAYACQNAMEYFAELSTAFLGGLDNEVEFNKWYPFNRQQIKEHDPRAYKLLQRMWKVQDDDDDKLDCS